MDYCISKRAEELSQQQSAVKKYISTVWKEDQGPLQNLFRLSPYFMVPFLGISTIIPIALTTVASQMLNLSLEEMGKNADEALGLKPGDDIRDIPGKIIEYFNSLFDDSDVEAITASYNTDKSISKTAGMVSSIVKSLGFGKIVFGYISKLVGAMASLFVFSSFDELTKKLTSPVREKVVEVEKEYFGEPTATKEPAGKKEKTKDPFEGSADEMADYLEQKYGLS